MHVFDHVWYRMTKNLPHQPNGNTWKYMEINMDSMQELVSVISAIVRGRPQPWPQFLSLLGFRDQIGAALRGEAAASLESTRYRTRTASQSLELRLCHVPKGILMENPPSGENVKTHCIRLSQCASPKTRAFSKSTPLLAIGRISAEDTGFQHEI